VLENVKRYDEKSIFSSINLHSFPQLTRERPASNRQAAALCHQLAGWRWTSAYVALV